MKILWLVIASLIVVNLCGLLELFFMLVFLGFLHKFLEVYPK